MLKDRLLLPVQSAGVRCPTGSAVLTGPGDYGKLQVPYVIHAVGPMYMAFPNYETPDNLLRSAYQESLDVVQKEGISDVAFSLLSAGVYRGDRDLKTILGIAVTGIKEWTEATDDPGALQSVSLVGFSTRERDVLLEICNDEFGENSSDEL